MSALGWFMLGTGGLLLWAGIRDENAVTVAIDVISGKRALKSKVVAGSGSTSTNPARTIGPQVLAPGLLSGTQQVVTR